MSHPDMLIWLWRAVREDDVPNRPTLPFRLHAPGPDLQKLIASLRKKQIDSTQIAVGYDAMNASFCLPESFGDLQRHCMRSVGTVRGRTADHSPDVEPRRAAEYTTRLRRIPSAGGLRDAELPELSQFNETAGPPGGFGHDSPTECAFLAERRFRPLSITCGEGGHSLGATDGLTHTER